MPHRGIAGSRNPKKSHITNINFNCRQMPNTTMGKFGRITTLKENDGQGGVLGGLVVVIQG